MPKKLFTHDDMSTRTCKTSGCTKRIKTRLVETRKNVRTCYRCHCDNEAKRNHGLGHRGSPRRKRVEAGLPIKVPKRILCA